MKCHEYSAHRKALAAAMETLEPFPPIMRAALSGRVARIFNRTIRQHEANCEICNESLKHNRILGIAAEHFRHDFALRTHGIEQEQQVACEIA